MLIGEVQGPVWADRQVTGLDGRRLVLVQPIGGHPLVAVDLMECGRGSRVLVATDEAAQAATGEATVDAAVVALVAVADEPSAPPTAAGGGRT
ncbi:EutN/CcmL family microcompartment protein [Pseudonocardia asaccharolytica]|uniref:Ethanolamine utilization protein EutN n=1 Tax=Pseudonocardia asaccharolytica DSM 44247 = NBRC 16224 TaxID=1123024 RepID=A0A511CXC3_9PSEU|nr:EutN/CcmL family microcompartment protein [Pseudonocardia asaccharolytica]GEL17210.1 hypothetical protein PA7_10470 [Pseudonocardia asaccharolytica DSM 44247 = NBRC 16224]